MEKIRQILCNKTAIACMAVIAASITAWANGEMRPFEAILTGLAGMIGITLRSSVQDAKTAASSSVPPQQAVDIGMKVVQALANVGNVTDGDRETINRIAAKLADDLRENAAKS